MIWMLPEKDRHPCRVCATWVCDACGWNRRKAARLRPEKQFCPRCQGHLGHFVDVSHAHPRIQREHDADARELIDNLPREVT